MKRGLGLLLVLSLFIGCSARNTKQVSDVMIGSNPSQEPEWIKKTIVETPDVIYATGHSRPIESEQGARDDAIARAIEEIVKYCGVTVDVFDRSVETYSQVQKDAYKSLDYYSRADSRAKAFIRRAVPERWYTKIMARMEEGRQTSQYYLVSVQIRVPRQELRYITDDRNIRLSIDFGIFHEAEGSRMEYVSESTVLKTGDAYAIYIKPSDDCYVYIYQVDDIGNVFRLFPSKEFNTGTNPLNAGEEYWIPNTGQLLVLDDTTGKEKVYVFGSTDKIRDLEGSAQIKDTDVARMIKTMGITGIREKSVPAEAVLPQRAQQVAHIKKKLKAEGAFAYETWFWHR